MKSTPQKNDQFPPYGISAEAYLARAKSLLASGRREDLFYAAFELRAGIEARMQEYLDVHRHISNKKKKGWQIAKLGRAVEQAFQTGDKVVEITAIEPDSNEIIACFYYTPVKAALRKKAQRLGLYLHAIKEKKVLNEEWWSTFRILLKQIIKELGEATEGMLLGPPLIQRSTGQVNMIVTGITNEGMKFLTKKMAPKQEIVFKVRYHSRLPKGAQQGVKSR